MFSCFNEDMPKPILISGIQPTGRLHLGNYLGALINFITLQNSGRYECFFFIADYHSLTEEFDWKNKKEQILNLVEDYFLAGVDHSTSTVFVQSAVPAHTELAWILSSITPFGELSRMIQFKEKSAQNTKNINVGLLYYPILMAADILLYDAKFVPVGDDQLQHLEFTRTLARKFNKKFGETFTEPEKTLTKTPRLMSLDDPKKKMSKSCPAGCLFVNDSPAEIKKKIMSAVTDSGNEVRYDPKNKKGISNLMLVYQAFSVKSLKQIEKDFTGRGYGEFKSELTKGLIKLLVPFRDKLAPARRKKIMEELIKGNKKANKIASAKLKEVKKKIGLL